MTRATFAALTELLRDPFGNPRAAALGILIVVVAFLLVVAVILAWAYGGASRRKREPGERKVARRRLLRVGVPVTLLVLLAAGYTTTSLDSYCSDVCHRMTAPGDSWRASSHASVACIRCHEGIPVVSAPLAIVSRSREVALQWSGAAAAGFSAVPSRRCLGCHGSILRGVVVAANGVAMDHAHVLLEGASCEDCHGAQGHEKDGRRPDMASCTACHDMARASAKCPTCHRKPADDLLRASSATVKFGKVTLPEKPGCACHAQKKCDECHGLRMPHPPGFGEAQAHAKLAAFGRKETLCYRCHTATDCGRCHKGFNAHAADWEHVHRTYPRDTGWCRPCHATPDMCGLCHGPSSGQSRRATGSAESGRSGVATETRGAAR